jgi:plastocyanin
MRVLLALALVLAACQQETAEQVQRTPREADAPQQQQAGSATRIDPTLPPEGAGVASADQHVQLIEYAIRMPQTLKAGPQSFHVTNDGKEIHNFEVEGNGVHQKLPSDLSRGSSAQMTVDLKPGTYTIYCPVDGHRQKGMELKVTVQ